MVSATPGWRALYPFASHYLDVGGHRLHYLDEGPRTAPVVLAVHGNPTWSFYWRALVLALRERHRVVVPDHLGCGLSDKPQDWPYRLDGHVENLRALVDHLELDHITLVVHDWGGAIGFGAATRSPDRYARFLITNTAAFPSPRIPLRIAACRIPIFGPLAVRGLNGFALAATRMATARGLAPEVAAGLVAPYATWADRIATLRFVQDIPLREDHPSWGTLQEIAAGLGALADRPTALVWGERDWCFTPAFREEWERRFPAATVDRVEHAGHYLMEDAPERVIAAAEALLRVQP